MIAAGALAAALAGPGCTMRKHAIRTLGDALAAGGAGSMSTDDDPELIRAAAPFGLKVIEALLAKQPKHRGLLLAAARGFTEYSYAFVQLDADPEEERDKAKAQAMRQRAEKLFLRARDYGMRGLTLEHPEFAHQLQAHPETAVGQLTAADVPLMFWTATAWAGAASDDLLLLPQTPQFEALILRALQLDESYDEGSLHTFMIAYEMDSPTRTGDKRSRATQHFKRAVDLSHGRRAAPYVVYAESVLAPAKDRAGFEAMLKKALTVDVDAEPASRLENVILQRRAQWLLGRIDKLFPARPQP